MHLAISNMAWRPRESEAMLALVAEHGVKGLEILPSLTFPAEVDPFAPSDKAVAKFNQSLERNGLKIISMQSLLHGAEGALLFGDEPARQRFEAGMTRAIDCAGRLHISHMVMGSPVQRAIPASVSPAQAATIAVDVFRRLGDLCLANGAKLAIEPNAAAYGTNFLNTIGQTIAFVKQVDHPAISVNFDIGSLIMNDEIAEAAHWFARAGVLASHVHVSEPFLAPAPQDAQQFRMLASAIVSQGYDGWFSIEMKAVGEDNLASVKTAVATCARALAATDQNNA